MTRPRRFPNWPVHSAEYAALHEPATGRVWSGTQTSFWYDRLPSVKRLFRTWLGNDPQRGSLNLWFVREFRFRSPKRIATGSERWPLMYVVPVLLATNADEYWHGLAMRTQSRESVAWLEVFSHEPLRRQMGVKDNDKVDVWVGPFR